MSLGVKAIVVDGADVDEVIMRHGGVRMSFKTAQVTGGHAGADL